MYHRSQLKVRLTGKLPVQTEVLYKLIKVIAKYTERFQFIGNLSVNHYIHLTVTLRQFIILHIGR